MRNPMLDTPDDFIGDGNEGMFVLLSINSNIR